MSAPSGESNAAKDEHDSEDPPRRDSKKYYKFLRIIGDGSFSNVYYCKDAESGHEVAIKVCDKNHIIKENKIEYIMREKEALNWCNSGRHPFITTLYSTFQDDERLYFVLTYAPNGDLLNYIRELGKFSVEQTRFYTAEIVHALEYLHHGLPNHCHIVHRDLKPENILIKRDMHIMLCDFGSVKLFDKDMNSIDIKRNSAQNSADREKKTREGRPAATNIYRTKSFVGTAQYVSPEVLSGKPSSFASDLWGLGCIIFQLLTGKWPFCGETEFLIFQRINSLDYSFPDEFDSLAKDLVTKLLVIDPTKRLGVVETGGYPVLRGHEFYSGVDFDQLARQTPPPLRKQGQSVISTHHVDIDESNVPFAAPPMSGGNDREIIIENAQSFGSLLGVDHERITRLQEQAKHNIYHKLIEEKLIIKSGFLDKRVGLFARRRMFVLTEGPRIFYIDAEKMVLKGEIPFSKDLRTEAKDFKVFFIHVPNRTYYLIDREGFAMEWVQEINAVWSYYYSNELEPVATNEADLPSVGQSQRLSIDLGQQKRGNSGKEVQKSSQYMSSSVGDSSSAAATVDVNFLKKSAYKK